MDSKFTIPLIICSSDSINNTKHMTTPWGSLDFEKDDGLCFGKNFITFLPQHGDFNCSCASCQLYRITSEQQQLGYKVTAWKPKK